MAFEFRDLVQDQAKRDEKFAPADVPYPVVLCDLTGNTVDAGGNAVDASVPNEPDRVYVKSYNDSTPFIVLNRNKVNPRGGIPCYVGYTQYSFEREVLDISPVEAGLASNVTQYSPYQGQVNYVQPGQLSLLKITPSSGLIVAYGSMEYDQYGGRAFVFSGTLSLSSVQPASGKVAYILIYLDMRTGILQTLSGTVVQDIAGVKPIKPDTPIDGIAAAYVRLDGDMTSITLSKIEEAKRLPTPNFVPGVVYNFVVKSYNVPADYTAVRGTLLIGANRSVTIQNGGRIVVL